MTKLLGIGLILLAALSASGALRHEARRRCRLLSELCRALELLGAELEARGAALPQLFASVRDKSDGEVKDFFRLLVLRLSVPGESGFGTIWSGAVRAAFPTLREEEREVLERVGAILGRYGTARQLSLLEGSLDELRAFRDAAARSLREEGRLILGLPLCAALLLILGLW